MAGHGRPGVALLEGWRPRAISKFVSQRGFSLLRVHIANYQLAELLPTALDAADTAANSRAARR